MIHALIKLQEGGGTSFHIPLSESELVLVLNTGMHNTFLLKELAVKHSDKLVIYNFTEKQWRVE